MALRRHLDAYYLLALLPPFVDTEEEKAYMTNIYTYIYIYIEQIYIYIYRTDIYIETER